MMRQLPPAATPIAWRDLWAGVTGSAQTVSQFQNALGIYLNSSPPSLFSSGRTALYVLLRHLRQKLPQRPRVLLPAYTCPAVVKVILDVGLQPVLVDLDPATFNFDFDELRKSADLHTLTIIAVHPFGIPVDLKPTQTIAQSVGALLIEDAAQALGAHSNNQPVGTIGDFGLYSLGIGKAISTGGGGVLVDNRSSFTNYELRITNLKSQISNLKSLISQTAFKLAIHPCNWWLATRLGVNKVGQHEASWGYRLTALTAAQAAVGTRLLERLDAINAARREKAERMMAHWPERWLLRQSANTTPIYLRLPLLLDSHEQREQIFDKLWHKGIGVGRLYEKSLARWFPQLATRSFPHADDIANRLLTLPTHHLVTPQDEHTIIQQLID